tara:strand:- start:466 stop:618 length:153 start_codon:yes stop_codon:yes gene_type:complete
MKSFLITLSLQDGNRKTGNGYRLNGTTGDYPPQSSATKQGDNKHETETME